MISAGMLVSVSYADCVGILPLMFVECNLCTHAFAIIRFCSMYNTQYVPVRCALARLLGWHSLTHCCTQDLITEVLRMLDD